MQFPIEQFTAKQQMFILAYCKMQHATNSAIEAGIKPSNASAQAGRWLANASIKAEIDRRLADRLDRYYVQPEKIIREMALMAFSSLEDFIAFTEDNQAQVDFSGVTKDQMRGLTEIVSEEFTGKAGTVRKTKIKLADKQSALMNLAKLIKMLEPERVTHEHTGQINHAHAHVVMNPRDMSPRQRELLKTALLALEHDEPAADEPPIEEDDDAGDHEAR
jgi:phage terminase small subunit